MLTCLSIKGSNLVAGFSACRGAGKNVAESETTMNVALPLGNMRELAPVLVSLEKSENRMLPVSTLLLSAGLLVHVAATVPKYNVKPTCRAAIELSAVTGRTVEMCEASEAQARNEMVKAWSTFTEAAKDRCLKTSARHAPSYVELLICLESMRDMQKR